MFYGGARGGGKSAGILMAFRAQAEKYGRHAKGRLFRRTYPETAELESLGRDILVTQGWQWLRGDREWVSPAGARLRLAHLDNRDDVMKYQGGSNTFLGFDELTHWPDDTWINPLRATLRSAAGVPPILRATGNPGGPGHEWVKAAYITPATRDPRKMFIPSKISDNPALMEGDPGYVDRLYQVGADWLVRAWLDGDWDIVPGAYLEGVWVQRQVVIEPREIPLHWKRFMAHDWGFAAPSATLWIALDEQGAMYVYRELYTCDPKKPNTGTKKSVAEVAKTIKRLSRAEVKAGIKYRSNVADSAMWSEQGHTRDIATMFRDEGVVWTPIKKGPRSRVSGLQELVKRLRQRKLFVFDTCKHLVRTVPALMPDPNDPEDIDTNQEDHLYDALRYAVMSRRLPSKPLPQEQTVEPGTFDYVSTPKHYERHKPLEIRL